MTILRRYILMKSKIYIFFTLIILQLIIIAIPCHANTSTNPNSSKNLTLSAEPRIDQIDWQYKKINGALYRRLYNYTTGTPLSAWELVSGV